jgi:hypothetical protein
MTAMIEVYYRAPVDERREQTLARTVQAYGGRLDYREPANQPDGPIVLTYEFDDRSRAEEAARALREGGEHVEGPQDYS